MIRRALAAVPAVLATALCLSVALAAPGDPFSDAAFDLTSGNDDPKGIAWDGTYLRVVDGADDKVYSYTSSGTYTSTADFDLTSGNDDPKGIAWDGTYLRVVDGADEKVYSYTSSGTYTSTADFDLASANGDPEGIAWDGTYLRVVDGADDKVYSYTSSGTYTSTADFDLASGNDNPEGIAWDGTYLRVVDTTDDKVYSYTSSGTYTSTADFDLASANGSPTGITHDEYFFRIVNYADLKVYPYLGLTTPSDTYGLTDDNRDFEAAISTQIVAYGNWKCVRSQSGEMIRLNNVKVTVHGFCAQPSGTNGMEIEIHLSASATYGDLNNLVNVTGHWWFLETTASAYLNFRIYDDDSTTEEDTADNISEGVLVFTEEPGSLESSNRLGFATMAKSVSDDDCAEESDADRSDDAVTDGRGFACSRSYLTALTSSDDAVLLFSLTNANKVEFADTPALPESVTVSRNSAYTTATLSWTLYDAVTAYEITRLTAVQVAVSDASRTEYGDPVTYRIEGTQAGIDEYVDATLQAHRTYQYRMRARGADSSSWSDWTEYVFSGAKPGVDLPAPAKLELERASDSVIASWSAPPGDLDGYNLQRQELIVAEGSTFFGNVVNLRVATTSLPIATTSLPIATTSPPPPRCPSPPPLTPTTRSCPILCTSTASPQSETTRSVLTRNGLG